MIVDCFGSGVVSFWVYSYGEVSFFGFVYKMRFFLFFFWGVFYKINNGEVVYYFGWS